MADFKELPNKTVDPSKIASFKIAGVVARSCGLGDGSSYPEGWEFCWAHQTFRCDGNGNWVNQNRDC